MNRQSFLSRVVVVAPLLVFTAGATVSCHHFIGPTRSAKTAVYRLALERALVQKEIQEYYLLEKDPVILTSENIDPTCIPRIPGIRLAVFTPEQIREKALADGDFMYLQFSNVRIGCSSARITLSNIASNYDPLNSTLPIMIGGGFTLKCWKVMGKWMGRVVSSWVV